MAVEENLKESMYFLKLKRIYGKCVLDLVDFVNKNKTEIFLLVLILITASFLRLYKISEYMTFLGDEGRDAIVVRKFLVDFDLMLLGPGTSIGGMYLGPLYYYLISIPMLLFGLSPVGPSVFVAITGVVTVFFVWLVIREWFATKGEVNKGALLASFLYAISPVVIVYSRSSWNPNVMPFFALLTIYAIWKVWAEKKWKWFIVMGVSFAFVLQSHYLGLVLLGVIGLFLFLISVKMLNLNSTFLKSSIEKSEKVLFIKYAISGLLIFLFLMSPLLIFDLRHDWLNFSAMKTFFTERQTTVSAKPWTSIPKLYPLFEQFNSRILVGTSVDAGKFISISIIVLSFFLLRKKVGLVERKALFLVFSWIAISLVGFGIYKQHIYDHYFGIIFPAIFILVGAHINLGRKIYPRTSVFLIIFFTVFLTYFNLRNIPLKFHPNRQMQRAESVAKSIVDKSGGKPFNFAIISENNYEDGYVFFFEKWRVEYKKLIADIPDSFTDQLFVVCEVEEEKCNPETNERPEMSWFGERRIVEEYDIEGYKLYKLIRNDK